MRIFIKNKKIDCEEKIKLILFIYLRITQEQEGLDYSLWSTPTQS